MSKPAASIAPEASGTQMPGFNSRKDKYGFGVYSPANELVYHSTLSPSRSHGYDGGSRYGQGNTSSAAVLARMQEEAREDDGSWLRTVATTIGRIDHSPASKIKVWANAARELQEMSNNRERVTDVVGEWAQRKVAVDARVLAEFGQDEERKVLLARMTARLAKLEGEVLKDREAKGKSARMALVLAARLFSERQAGKDKDGRWEALRERRWARLAWRLQRVCRERTLVRYLSSKRKVEVLLPTSSSASSKSQPHGKSQSQGKSQHGEFNQAGQDARLKTRKVGVKYLQREIDALQFSVARLSAMRESVASLRALVSECLAAIAATGGNAALSEEHGALLTSLGERVKEAFDAVETRAPTTDEAVIDRMANRVGTEQSRSRALSTEVHMLAAQFKEEKRQRIMASVAAVDAERRSEEERGARGKADAQVVALREEVKGVRKQLDEALDQVDGSAARGAGVEAQIEARDARVRALEAALLEEHSVQKALRRQGEESLRHRQELEGALLQMLHRSKTALAGGDATDAQELEASLLQDAVKRLVRSREAEDSRETAFRRLQSLQSQDAV